MLFLPIGTCPFTHPFIHTSIHHKFIPLTLFRRLAMFVHSFIHSLVAHSDRFFCQPAHVHSLVSLLTYSHSFLSARTCSFTHLHTHDIFKPHATFFQPENVHLLFKIRSPHIVPSYSARIFHLPIHSPHMLSTYSHTVSC